MAHGRGDGVIDVSVVVPTRNRSQLLATTLRSVLRQRGVALELIVVDEASSDDTAQVVAAFEDARTRVIHHAVARGPNAARNRGGFDARGEWVAFIDDDDLWAPDKLARQLRAADEAGRGWVYAGSVNVNEQLDVIHGVPPPSPAQVMAELPRHNAIPASASNVIMRRSAFVAYSGFNENLRACEEWDLWLRLAKDEPPAWVPSPLVAYRMHAGNATLDVAGIIAGARMIEQLHGTTIDWGRFHWWIAQLCVRNGRRGDALREYGKAALAGRHREVRADLVTLARRTLRRHGLGGVPEPARRADVSWEDQARVWIDELRRSPIEAAGGR
ncbi:MAG: glycosyltransferase [Actinomycetota bacterium]|nr:glycosyltransferase [Actinomycetota bacterium]